MTLGSFLLGLCYYAVAALCLAAFKHKKKSPDAHRGLRAYLDAIRSFLLALAKRRTKLPELARAASPWFFLALFLLLLGGARQFNLQVMITESVQTEAVIAGWYDERRDPQLRFVIGAGISGAVAALALLILLRKRLADAGVAVLAATLLPVLLLVRAASHHDVDELLMIPILGVAPAHFLEVAALSVLAAAALASSRRGRALRMKATAPIVARIESSDSPRSR